MPLHPQAQQFLNDLAEQNPPGWDELQPQQGRDVFASLAGLFGDAEPVQRVEQHDNLRLYVPEGTGPFPAIVYFHGGGWVLGSVETHDALCRRLANAAACVVASVDYRRSPEAKFPEPLQDCYAATSRIAKQAEQFGIDAERIAVAGDSVGGNLAAAVALMARDKGGPAIHFQLLIVPVLSHDFGSGSYNEFAEGFALTKATMEWFWEQYLTAAEDGRNPLASPLLAEDLHGLPPAHVVTAEYDVLRDEGEAYVARLKEAGVRTTHRRYDGMIHGFMHFAGVFDVGKQSVLDVAAVLRNAMVIRD